MQAVPRRKQLRVHRCRLSSSSLRRNNDPGEGPGEAAERAETPARLEVGVEVTRAEAEAVDDGVGVV